MDKKDKKKTKHAPEAATEQPAGGNEETERRAFAQDQLEAMAPSA